MTSKMLLSAVPAAGGGFNPQTDITWHSLFWAEGTAFAALGLADGDRLTTWPNETGESAPTTNDNNKRPYYVAADTFLNSQPTVDWQGTGTQGMTSPAFGTNPTAPLTMVVIAGQRSSATLRNLMVERTSGSAQCRIYYHVSTRRIYAGTSEYSGGSSDNSPHMFAALFDGSSGNDWFDIDGTRAATGNAGSNTLDGVTLGGEPSSGASNLWNGPIAFAGIYEGDITGHAKYADFKTWVASHYGLTIA